MATYNLHRTLSLAAGLIACATAGLVFVAGNTLSNGRIAYITIIVLLYVPAIWLFAVRRYQLAVVFIAVANLVRWDAYLLRYGMFSGVDNYLRYHRFVQLIETGRFGFLNSDGYPGAELFIAALNVPFGGAIDAWNAALLCTAVLLPVVCYLVVSRLMGRQLAVLASLVFSNDFIYLLNSTSLLKSNIALLLLGSVLFLGPVLTTRGEDSRPVLRGLLLVSPLVFVVSLTHYTSSYLLVIVLCTLVVAYAGLGTFSRRFDPGWLRLKYLFGAVLLLGLSILLWAGVGADRAFLDWQFDLFRSFLNVMVGDEPILTVSNSVGGSDETQQFLFGSDPFLRVYNWVYRGAMLLGAAILLPVLFRSRWRDTGYVLAGVAVTGFPIVWLVLPLLSDVLHATRVARFALLFYVPFIAAVVLTGLRFGARFQSSSIVRALVVVLLLSAAFTAPSAYKSSTGFDFRNYPHESTTPTTGHTELQLETWSLVTTYANGTVGGPAQFNEIAYMTGTTYESLPNASADLVVYKKHSEESGRIIGFVGPIRKPVPFAPTRPHTVYSNGYYVARYGQNTSRT